jgi:hypothetical protein
MNFQTGDAWSGSGASSSVTFVAVSAISFNPRKSLMVLETDSVGEIAVSWGLCVAQNGFAGRPLMARSGSIPYGCAMNTGLKD